MNKDSTLLYLMHASKMAHLKVFVTGAILGTAVDAWHVYAGIASYADPCMGKQAWWVPLLMGATAWLIAVLHVQVHPKPLPMREYRRRLIIFLTYFLASYGLAASLERTGAENALLIGVAFCVSWGYFDRFDLKNGGLAFLSGLLGSVIEGSLGIKGVYFYNYPDWMGLPFWLPILYMHGTLAAGYLGRILLQTPDTTKGTQ